MNDWKTDMENEDIDWRKSADDDCAHENTMIKWEGIPGEPVVQQPAYEVCLDCGRKV